MVVLSLVNIELKSIALRIMIKAKSKGFVCAIM